MWIALLILLVSLILMGGGWIRRDLVALLILAALMLTGLTPLDKALISFSDPLILMLIGLCVISAGLMHSGVASWLSLRMIKLLGDHELVLTLSLILSSALLAAFMSPPGALIVILPLAMGLADEANLAPARLLIPTAFAAGVGGSMTLIGSPSNLIVAKLLYDSGQESFSLFSFAPIAIAALFVLCLYFISLGRYLLPHDLRASAQKQDLRLQALLRRYGLTHQLHWYRLPSGSRLLGQKLESLEWGESPIQILCTRPSEESIDLRVEFCQADTEIKPHQDILLQGSERALAAFAEQNNLSHLQEAQHDLSFFKAHLGLGELLIMPRSPLTDKSLRELHFRDRFGTHVLALLRRGRLLKEELADVILKPNDLLLIQGPWRRIWPLREERTDFLALDLPGALRERPISGLRLGLIGFWMLLLVVLLTMNWVPMVVGVWIVAAGMIFSRCLSLEEAYRAVAWETILPLVGFFALVAALSEIDFFNQVASLASGLENIYLLISLIFILATLISSLSHFIPAIMLTAPLALVLAQQASVEPRMLMMTAAIASASGFASPWSSFSNRLIRNPGGYSKADYFRLGLPLQLLILVICLGLIPFYLD